MVNRNLIVIKSNDTLEVIPVQSDVGLGFMQELVDGYIEVVRSQLPGIVIVCNEEGKLRGLEPNRIATALTKLIPDDFICGNVFLAREEEESLLPMDAHRTAQLLAFLAAYTPRDVILRGIPILKEAVK